jgi:hypothetical protein
MTYMPKKLDTKSTRARVNSVQLARAVAQARSAFFKKAAAAPPIPEPLPMPEPVRSRIKMIAATEQIVYPDDTAEHPTHLNRQPTVFALTHDDRIFLYDADDDHWNELPPLPE